MSSSTDVVVIGSGVFGLAAAWELAKNGRSVTVLDRAPVGTEASGWALGRLDPLLRGSGSTGTTEKDLPPGHIAKPEAQQELALLSYNAHQEMTPEIEDVSGIDLQVDHQPTLQLFYSDEEREFGAQYVAEWTGMGFKTDLVSADQIVSIDPRFLTTEFGGALVQGPYFIDSLSFVKALSVCAKASGVKLETASVSSIDSSSSSDVTVHTDQGHYDAETAIVAAGPWTTGLVEPFGVKLPVHPSKGEILRLEPPAGKGFSMHVHGPCSLVNKRDGLVWVAATAADSGFDRAPTDGAKRQLLENAGSMIAESADWPIAKHTVCFRPATPDDLPIVGSVSENVLVATGGGGSGIVQCLHVGRQVEKMVSAGDTEPEETAISLSRFSD